MFIDVLRGVGKRRHHSCSQKCVPHSSSNDECSCVFLHARSYPQRAFRHGEVGEDSRVQKKPSAHGNDSVLSCVTSWCSKLLQIKFRKLTSLPSVRNPR